MKRKTKNKKFHQLNAKRVKRGIVCPDANHKGALFTFDRNHERDCIRELTILFQEYSEKLYPLPTPSSPSSPSQLDITQQIELELKGLKEDNNEKINFRVWDVNCPGIAFASITLPSSLPLHLQSNFPSSSSSTATDKTKSQTTSSSSPITTTTTSDDHSLSFDISLLPNNDNNSNDDHSSSSSSSESKEGSTTVQFTVTDFIRYIYTDITMQKKQKTRYVHRLIPIEGTCASSLVNIHQLLKPYITSQFHSSTSKPQSYCLYYKCRHNQFNRSEFIEAVTSLVGGYPHSVDLNTPNTAILIEIMGTLSCINVIPNYHDFNDFKFRLLTSSSTSTSNRKLEDGNKITKSIDRENSNTTIENSLIPQNNNDHQSNNNHNNTDNSGDDRTSEVVDN